MERERKNERYEQCNNIISEEIQRKKGAR